MVGHTHEDVDQFFSCIRNCLFKNNVRTLSCADYEMTAKYFEPTISNEKKRKIHHNFQWNVRLWFIDNSNYETDEALLYFFHILKTI